METLTAQKVLTVDEAMAALRISKSTFHRRVADGTIRTVRLGKRVLVRPEELDRVLAANEGPATFPQPAPLPPTTEPRRR